MTDMRKAVAGGAYVPGQVPRRGVEAAGNRALDRATAMPPVSVPRDAPPGRPVLRAADVAEGLGLDEARRRRVVEAARTAQHTDNLAQALGEFTSAMRLESGLDPALARTLTARVRELLENPSGPTAQARAKRGQGFRPEAPMTKALIHVTEEIPEWLDFAGAMALAKGADHKYVRRIVTGKASPKYRYIYAGDLKPGRRSRAKPKVGEKIKVSHEGQAGHYAVTKVHDDGHVEVHHDETGHRMKIKADKLHDLFRENNVDDGRTVNARLSAEHAKADRLPRNRKEVLTAIMDAAGIDDHALSRLDEAYSKWKAGGRKGPKPERPKGGGELDSLSADKRKGKGFSSLLEAFESATKNAKTWRDIADLVHGPLRDVPGFENAHLPEDVLLRHAHQYDELRHADDDHFKRPDRFGQTLSETDDDVDGDTDFNFGANVQKSGAHKYLSKVWKNGAWVYTYAEDQKPVAHTVPAAPASTLDAATLEALGPGSKVFSYQENGQAASWMRTGQGWVPTGNPGASPTSTGILQAISKRLTLITAAPALVVPAPAPAPPPKLPPVSRPSVAYVNNLSTDVSMFHPVIMAAIANGGVFDEDYADILGLFQGPNGVWALVPPEDPRAVKAPPKAGENNFDTMPDPVPTVPAPEAPPAAPETPQATPEPEPAPTPAPEPEVAQEPQGEALADTMPEASPQFVVPADPEDAPLPDHEAQAIEEAAAEVEATPTADEVLSKQKKWAVGGHIFGSVKDKVDAARMVREGRIGELGDAVAAMVTNKASLMPTFDLADLRGRGVSPGAAHMITQIVALVAPKPGPTAKDRDDYARGIRLLAGSLQKVRTRADVDDLMKDLRAKAQSANLLEDKFPTYSAALAHAEKLQAMAPEGVTYAVSNWTGFDSTTNEKRHLVEVRDPESTSSLAALGQRFATQTGLGKIVVKNGRGTFPETSRLWVSTGKIYRDAEKLAAAADNLGDGGWDHIGAKLAAKSEAQGKKNKKPSSVAAPHPYYQAIAEVPDLAGTKVAIAEGDKYRLEKTFGLGMLQRGEKISKKDLEHHLRHTEMALHDLADVMGLDPKDVSLNGRLKIAFGARGTGNAAAHFEPGEKVINLTRFAGAGTLAHEWGHFLDNVLAETGGADLEGRIGVYGTTTPAVLKDPELRTRVNAVLEAMREPVDKVKAAAEHKAAVDKVTSELAEKRKVFEAAGKARNDIAAGLKAAHPTDWNQRPEWLAAGKAVTDAIDDYNATVKEYNTRKSLTVTSNFMRDAKERDAAKKKPYWSTSLEMFARGFEGYVQDKLEDNGRRNSYLVDGTRGLDDVPYPQGQERKRINQAFDQLFAHLRSTGTLKKALAY